jgi:hypothetical protein
MGHLPGNTTARIDPFSMGPNQANTAIVFTLDDYNAVDNYALTASDVVALLGDADPATIGPAATYRCRWTLAGTTGAQAAIGDDGLKNACLTGTPDGSDFATVTGSGTAVYAEPLVMVPAVTAHAYVAGCGKLIGLTLTADSDGSSQAPTLVFETPRLAVNGQDLGPLTNPAFPLGVHSCLLYSTPGSVQINPGDEAALTAPGSWCDTAVGLVAALEGAIDNRSGKSSVQTELLEKTMPLSLNMSASLEDYFPWKNLKYKTGWGYGKLPPGSYQMTTNPGEIGQWLLVWNPTKPATPAMMEVVSGNPALVAVSHLSQYDQSPASGIGYVRVFDVEAVAGSAWESTIGGFVTLLKISDPAYAGKPNYDDLWIYPPSEWSLENGVPVYDRSDPFALSTIYRDRVTEHVGSLRWCDTGAGGAVGGSYPYPEMLIPMTAENFWGNHPTGPRINYLSIGPVDGITYPYEYHWEYGRDGCQGGTFTATLTADVTTVPAVDTHETWTFSDGATAPLLAGLEVTVDGETVRIISGSGTSWVVNRGSNGTTPVAHTGTPKAAVVNGRRPLWMGSSGLVANATTCLITCDRPHGMVDRQTLSQAGAPINNITMTSGTVVNNLQLGNCYVTGPTTFVSVASGGSAAGDKPDKVYTLTGVYGQNQYWYGSGVPVEIQAITTAKFPNANLYVNIPVDAVDDMVYAYARRILAHFPAGRKIYVEYTNEVWNWAGAFASFAYVTVVADLVLSSSLKTYQFAYATFRSTKMHTIFRSVFGPAGRGDEIVGVVGCQMGSGASQITPALNLALSLGAPLDAIACAPYYSMSPYPASVAAFDLYDDDQAADMLLHDKFYDMSPGGMIAYITDNYDAVQAYNRANDKHCIMIGYEGGIEFAAPAGAKRHDERSHDIQYHPIFYDQEQGVSAIYQKYGFSTVHIYGLGIGWGPQSWAMYHGRTQPHSRGDGQNGATDNRKVSVNPNSPYWIGKGMTFNQSAYVQDQRVHSVRGQAYIDWGSETAANPGPDPGPDPGPETTYTFTGSGTLTSQSGQQSPADIEATIKLASMGPRR